MSESKIKHRGRTEKPNRRLNASHPGVYKAKQLHDKRKEAQNEACADRIGMAEGRSPQEQVARLNRRLGAGSGAVRERSRLATLIAAQGGSQSVVESVAKPAKLSPAEKVARKSRKEAKRAADLAAHNAQTQNAGK